MIMCKVDTVDCSRINRRNPITPKLMGGIIVQHMARRADVGVMQEQTWRGSSLPVAGQRNNSGFREQAVQRKCHRCTCSLKVDV